MRKWILCLAGLQLTMTAWAAEYGETDFQATGSGEAYPVFIRGLLQLHNFEFEDARKSFQEVQALDRDFYLGYWGEAMSHKQPLWNREDLKAGNAALAKLRSTAKERLEIAPTPRERAYMEAVHRWIDPDIEENQREIDYAQMMGAIYDRWPNDIDAGAFYALAILTTSHNGREFDKYMRAGAITEEILAKHPRHPGALHYNIHSFDDPIHAPLGLRAANVYSQVAPDAVHALHMPSHIYFALGDYEGVRDLNLRSYAASVARRNEFTGNLSRREGYHSHSWLVYAYIQLHQFDEARERLAFLESRMGEGDPLAHGQLVMGRAFLVLETGEFEDPILDVEVDLDNLSEVELPNELYIRARKAMASGDMRTAEKFLGQIEKAESPASQARDAVGYLMREIGYGQLLIAKGEETAGLTRLEKIANFENTLDPFIGPPVSVQPAGEAAGDALRAAGRLQDAIGYYEMTLKRAVNKTRSLHALREIRDHLEQGKGTASLRPHRRAVKRYESHDAMHLTPDLPALMNGLPAD